MEVTLERRRRDAERHRIARENETPEQTQTRRQHENDWRKATRRAENDIIWISTSSLIKTYTAKFSVKSIRINV